MSARALPLRGLRVVNFGVGGVAPWGSSLLAQLGANVVKIEAPNEFLMYTLPPWRSLTTTYAAVNANVYSVKLNLKNEADRVLAWRLVESADVMLENFRSGAIDRMGFGFHAVAARNAKIVFCSSSGFGREGEMAGLPCTDPHMQAFSGFAALNGHGGGERIRYYAMIDLYCAQLVCEAVLAALVARRALRKPQYIEMNMLGGATSMLMTKLAPYLRGGPPPTHRGARHSAPDGLYRTADGTVAVTVETDAQFASLCNAVQRSDLASDARFATADARLANTEALDAELERAFQAGPSDWWLIGLGRAGIACARVHADHETSAHRDTWRRGHLREIAVHGAGSLRVASSPWDFEGIRPVPGRAPRPGEHTELLRRDPASFWSAMDGGEVHTEN
jgi:CoA:oxalate CoA-transferase